MKKLTHQEREKIQNLIKNKIDISDKIINKDLAGENLTGAIISKFDRLNCDMSHICLANTTLGSEGKVTIWSTNNLRHANFTNTIFLGTFFVRNCDCRNANFGNAWLPNFEYQHSDFRGAKFCSAVIRIGSREGLGAMFDEQILKDLCKGWKIQSEEKYDGNKRITE